MSTPSSSGSLVLNPLLPLISLVAPTGADPTLLAWAKRLLLAMLVFACFWLLSQAATWLIERFGNRLTAFTKTDLDNRVLKRIAPSVSLFLVFAGIYLAVRTLPLHERLVKLVAGGLYIANVVIACLLIYRGLNECLAWYLERRQRDEGDASYARQMIPLAEKVIMLFIIGGALVVVLKHFHYDILSLVTALGIGSLAIGMAAKDTLAHLISGFTLMLDRPFRIGDRIQLVGGQIGDVQDIGLRSTKIKTLDNQLLIIPNSDLCNTQVTNQALPDRRIKGRINVGVAYGSDIEQIKPLLVELALQDDEVLREPMPEAFFTTFGDSSLNLALFFWVEDYTRLLNVTDRLNSTILARFRERGIEIPFPTRTMIMQPQEGTVPPRP